MSQIRNTKQLLLPLKKEYNSSEYDPYPVFELDKGVIQCGFQLLAERLAAEPVIIIDGYVGIHFDTIVEHLVKSLNAMGRKVLVWDVTAAFKPESDIDRMIEPYLGGDDPIFGFRTDISLNDYFDQPRLHGFHPDPNADVNIIYGPGASLAGWNGAVVYVDIPKNEIQFRARAASISNLGATSCDNPKRMYKRFYFVDWVVLNKHKKSLLHDIDIMVDGQRDDVITWMEGDALREGLRKMSLNGFRVRPWFEPGAWGGQWIRNNIRSLPSDVPNYAWSFELIVPENGLIFSSDGIMLEVSFDTLMFEAGENVVGRDCYAAYGDEFPIRMDYLDNFDGGNLSIQCHPHKPYIQKNFGEVLTQEETYYILDTRDDSVVYLGFKDDIDPKRFEKALTESFENGTPLDVDKYINAEVADKHGLYLIPPGTLHSSGRNNLVLEISTTPYIFTFKMYDWLSLDLDGKPRPLNIRRAMDNLCFDRKGDKVKQELVSKPRLISTGPGWERWHLPTHANHSYDVNRYKVSSTVAVETEGKCHVLNLVEGTGADIVTADDMRFHLSYGETFVVSAAAGSYTIVNSDGNADIMVVVAFMK